MIEIKPIKSSAPVKAFIAENLPSTTLEVACLTELSQEASDSITSALSGAIAPLVEKIQNAVAEEKIPDYVGSELIAGFAFAVESFSLTEVTNFTGAKRKAICEELGSDPWKDLSNASKPVAKGKTTFTL